MTTEPLQHTDKAIAEVIDKLTQLAQAHGNDALLLGGKVYQMAAVSNLTEIVPFATVAVGGFFLSRFLFRKWRKAEQSIRNGDDAVGFMFLSFISIIVTLAGFVGTLVGLTEWLNPLVWAAAFDPQVALAAHILKAL